MTSREEYTAIAALNFSVAKWLLVSPWHYQKALAGEEAVEETLDMALGTALHAFFFEGVTPKYVVRPQELDGKPWHGSRAVCKQWKADKEAEGYVVFNDESETRQMRMIESLKSNALFQSLVGNSRGKEEVFTCTYRGVPLKGRLDLWAQDAQGNHWILDLKKCRDASPKEFGKRRAYGRLSMQAEWYSTLLSMRFNLETRPIHIWTAIEDSFACPVAHYRHNDPSQVIGRRDMDTAIDRYLQCMETGVWPAYGDGILDPETFAWE